MLSIANSWCLSFGILSKNLSLLVCWILGLHVLDFGKPMEPTKEEVYCNLSSFCLGFDQINIVTCLSNFRQEILLQHKIFWIGNLWILLKRRQVILLQHRIFWIRNLWILLKIS